MYNQIGNSNIMEIEVKNNDCVKLLYESHYQISDKHAGIAFINSVPEGTYDVIILDAFQPMGPIAEVLADNCFLESVAKALRPGGVLSAPADSLWHKNFIVADTIANSKKIFKGSVNYAWTTVPTYASGVIGFMLCSTEGPPVNFKHPINPLNPKHNGVAKGPPKFYNSEVIYLKRFQFKD